MTTSLTRALAALLSVTLVAATSVRADDEDDMPDGDVDIREQKKKPPPKEAPKPPPKPAEPPKPAGG